MPETILYDSAMRLFGDLVTPEVAAAAEQGGWPDRLWQAVEAAGYPDVLAEGVGGMAEAATVLRAAGHHAAPIPLAAGHHAAPIPLAAGHHAAPIPLAETMLAPWLCAACGVEAPA